MSNWRDYILQHFQEPAHRLTLVADPDGLMLEEELLAAIRQNGFDMLPFDDAVAFRYAYESSYRQRWDEGGDTDLVVILRSPQASLRTLPYDLLQTGRALAFGLPDLFPSLSYPVVKELELAYLQPLYEACQRYAGPEMGDRASALFVLKHVFGLAPDMIKAQVDVLKLLLSRHARGERVPPRLDALLLASLHSSHICAGWPLEALLRSAVDFFAFLQHGWFYYLAAQQPAGVLAHEPGMAYEGGGSPETGGSQLETRNSKLAVPLPFDEPDVRAYVDTLFLEGKLKPAPLPEGWSVEGWAEIGVESDELASDLRRCASLLERLEGELPAAGATHKDWMSFAGRWAELTILRYRLQEPGTEMIERYGILHLRMERQFADWMLARYHTLHSLPFLPAPVMVHRIPDLMAAHRGQRPGCRQALVVVDGLALDQWLIIRDVWATEAPSWSMQEGATFAWVPTLTPISRQATFAGAIPQFLPDSWQSTEREPAHWERFWCERGLYKANIGYLRNLGVKGSQDEPDSSLLPDSEATLEPELQELLGNPQIQVVGLVLNTVDNIMHGMQLGTAGMHQQVQLWMAHYRYLTKLISRLVEESFTVYLTSDHGNVWAKGIGRPSEGVLVERRGERARIYTDPAFLAIAKRQSPTAIEWTNVGLPPQLQVLLAPQLDAFLNVDHHAVCHGGLALEEVVVPFVQISQGLGL
ncbi:MAG: BREX-3 system phosphatase PglZ [Thermoflexales bacterium]|nr:BREX-3 system phosphatase PglZ [Thermoflexales bacterium]